MAKENINLPKVPKDLCFSELDFIQVINLACYTLTRYCIVDFLISFNIL